MKKFFHRFTEYQYKTSRIEAFSDGVFAIVITLLILEIHVPKISHNTTAAQSFAAFWNLRPQIFSWLISFFICGVGWIQHHNILHMARKCDLGILCINLLVLMGFCFLPFAAAFMGENPADPFTLSLFGVVMFIASLFLCLLYYYIAKFHLRTEVYDQLSVLKNVRKAFFAAPCFYIIAILSSWIHINIAYVLYAIVPLLFVFPLDREKKNVDVS